MTSLVGYLNRFHDQRAARTVFTDVGGSFSSAQPLENMAKMQLPTFAEFTGATAELDVAAVVDSSADPVVAESFDADVFGVLGHTLPDGAVVEFLDDTTLLGTVTVANYEGLPRHAILVLDSAVSLDTLTVSITNAGSGGRIGAVWASASFRPRFGMGDFSKRNDSLSQAQWAAATAYTNERESYRLTTLRFPGMPKAMAVGPDWPNWEAITTRIGVHAPVLIVPDTSEMAYSMYAKVDSFVETRPHLSPAASLWRGGMDLREMK